MRKYEMIKKDKKRIKKDQKSPFPWVDLILIHQRDKV